MNILGLNAFHGDSSACILMDGILVAAAEEERFRRIKHWAGFPSEAIACCLKETGLKLSDVDFVAVNQDGRANFWRKVAYTLVKRPSLSLIIDRLRNRGKRSGIPDLLAKAFPNDNFRGEFRPVEHHMAHLSSAFHVSPFEEAAIVSVDGFGDFSSAAWGYGKGSDIRIDGRVYFPHSMGIFYSALTQFIGFPHYGDEYKVMGLAPYGKPSMLGKMRQIVKTHEDGTFSLNLDYFRHHKEGVPYSWENGVPEVGTLFSDRLADLLGPARKVSDALEDRHRDLAHSIQAMFEEVFFNLLDVVHKRTDSQNIAIAGGCGMNSVANGKIRRNSPFKNVYVQSAAGDAGGAIGSAYAVWHERHPARSFVMDHAYLGPSYGEDEMATLIEERKAELDAAGCSVEHIANEAALCARTAAAIADGKVIGWFQGRMEWGPRALGNRSIVCDPRRSDMKQILNAKIKKRESFRPFAPSVMQEHVGEWFEEDDDVPFMMQVFQIREEKRPEIPAVTHVDGSGRLQTVHKHTNQRYHALISAFYEMTGVPMVLNTSFNENEPVVCRPVEALNCFLRTNMDLLVLGDYMISRRPDKLD